MSLPPAVQCVDFKAGQTCGEGQAHVVLDRIEVVNFLPQQNANAVLQNVVVPFCGMNAGEGSIPFDDNVHVLA
jgi:hypothetical protein